MTRTISKATARRIITSTLAALVLTAVLPQIGLAAPSEAGLWKIDPAKSKFSAGAATLTIRRAHSANPAAGSLIVISKGSVYLVTGAEASASNDVKQVDYGRMMRDGKAVLLGTNARSTDLCGFRCQGGLAEPRLTLTFKAISGAGQQINDMLAEGK